MSNFDNNNTANNTVNNIDTAKIPVFRGADAETALLEGSIVRRSPGGKIFLVDVSRSWTFGSSWGAAPDEEVKPYLVIAAI